MLCSRFSNTKKYFARKLYVENKIFKDEKEK